MATALRDSVQQALSREAPGCSFADEVVESLASALEKNLAEDSENALFESWCPLLISNGASSDDDEVRLLCRRLLAQLRNRDSSPPARPVFEELNPWLERLHLVQYDDEANAWCSQNNVASLDQLLQNWQSFADNVKLKFLERKRVERAFIERSWFGPPNDPYRYTMLEKIGSGGYANVHRCSRGQDIFAVKNISLTKLRMQTDYRRVADNLHNEVSILFALRHPRIVALFDVIEVQDQVLHLVMEYVEGGDLHGKILEKKSFSEPLAKYVFRQVAEGLAFIHSKDIVHRDLKPENVLVDKTNSTEQNLEVKLADFGVSKIINNGYSIAMSHVGTEEYQAPEVGDPKTAALGYDQTADLWSLGVVLYVMMVGSYPYGRGAVCTDAHIRRASYRSLATGREISESSKNLIGSLIRVDRKKRLPLDDCMKHPWMATVAAAAVDQHVPQALEMRIPLPIQPSKDQRKLLKQDLHMWQKRYHMAAVVKQMEVIVTYGEQEEADLDTARQELHEHLKRHLGPK